MYFNPFSTKLNQTKAQPATATKGRGKANKPSPVNYDAFTKLRASALAGKPQANKVLAQYSEQCYTMHS